MADNPPNPDPAGLLNQAAAVAPESDPDPAFIWSNPFPWGDLNAQRVPLKYLRLGTFVQPSLAVLSAQGPDQPHLLKTDLLSRLATVSTGNPVDKAQRAQAVGDQVLAVGDQTQFPPGTAVQVIPPSGRAVTYRVQGFAAGNVLNLTTPVIAAINAGDFVVGVPTTAGLVAAPGTAVPTWGIPVRLGSWTSGGAQPLTFALQPMSGLALSAVASVPSSSFNMQAVGNLSGADYFAQVPGIAGVHFAYFVVPILDPDDTNLTFTWTNADAWTFRLWAIGSGGALDAAHSQSVALASGGATAPWSAPTLHKYFNVALGVGANAQLIAGVVGQRIYLFDVVLTQKALSPAGLNFNLYDGTVAGGTLLADTWADLQREHVWRFSGKPLGVGNDLTIQTFGYADQFMGYATYSQA